MAKSDSFFIRATKDLGNTSVFHQKLVDIGAFVDALGKTVLRIHNIEVVYSDSTGRSSNILGNEVGVAQFQLTTQSQTDIVLASNKSVVATGKIHLFNDQGTTKLASQASDMLDVGPQHWTNGYLVGVESLYLGGAASAGFEGDVYVSIILECTVESLSKEGAMALALSQQ